MRKILPRWSLESHSATTGCMDECLCWSVGTSGSQPRVHGSSISPIKRLQHRHPVIFQTVGHMFRNLYVWRSHKFFL